MYNMLIVHFTAGEIRHLKKWWSLAELLAGDHLVKHNGHFCRKHKVL